MWTTDEIKERTTPHQISQADYSTAVINAMENGHYKNDIKSDTYFRLVYLIISSEIATYLFDKEKCNGRGN